MYRQNLIKFGIQIRRQKKLSLFKDLRRQHLQIQQIQRNLDELFHTPVSKQNFNVIRDILRQINENMKNISSKMTKTSGISYHQGETQKLHTNVASKFNRILTSSDLKGYLLDIFEKINESRMKFNMNQLKQQNELEKQVVILLGLILKQPYFLIRYFPLTIFGQVNCHKQTQIFQNQIIIDNNNQQDIYQSFELLQHIFFYLKQNLSTFSQIVTNTKTFLTLIHSVTRIIQHFTLNSIMKNINNKNITFDQKDDSQSLNFFYQLLKSNTFEHYLKQLIMDMFQVQNGNTFLKDKHNMRSTQHIKFWVINMAIGQVCTVYMDLVHKVNQDFDFSKMFVKALLKFTENNLRVVHYFNSQTYIEGVQEVNQINQVEKVINVNVDKYQRYLSLCMLFQLSMIVSDQKIQAQSHTLICLCNQIMVFLFNIKVNQGLKHNNRGISKQQINNNKAIEQLIDNKSTVEYYLDILLCQQQSHWFSQLQLIGCLFKLVSQHNITLQQLFSHTLQQNSFYLSPVYVKVDTKFILQLFETLGHQILTLSGTFYNQRHRFITTIVYLFSHWYQSVQSYQNKEKNKYQNYFQQQFTLEFMLNLGQIVLNYLHQLKSSISTNNQLLQIPITHNNQLNQHSSFIITQNTSILQNLTLVQQSLLDLLQNTSQQTNIQIQI